MSPPQRCTSTALIAAAAIAVGRAINVPIGVLYGTALKNVQIELAATGGTAPDGQLDNVLASAINGNNTIVVSSAAGVVSASGLPTGLKIEHADATDVLTINSLSCNDTINASMLAAGVISLTLNGGDGNDTITGKRWQGHRARRRPQ